jgi:hypothetical protein
MQAIEFEGIAVLVPEQQVVQTLITPRAADKTGYFSFSNSDLRLKKLNVVVLNCEKKVLNIPPYFANTEFEVLQCVPASDEFLEEYGNFATELCELRLVGKSKDVFNRALGSLVKAEVVSAMRECIAYDSSKLFPFVAELEMIAEINKDGKRYFSVSAKLTPGAKLANLNLNAIDWHYVRSKAFELCQKSLPQNVDNDVDY